MRTFIFDNDYTLCEFKYIIYCNVQSICKQNFFIFILVNQIKIPII